MRPDSYHELRATRARATRRTEAYFEPFMVSLPLSAKLRRKLQLLRSKRHESRIWLYIKCTNRCQEFFHYAAKYCRTYGTMPRPYYSQSAIPRMTNLPEHHALRTPENLLAQLRTPEVDQFPPSLLPRELQHEPFLVGDCSGCPQDAVVNLSHRETSINVVLASILSLLADWQTRLGTTERKPILAPHQERGCTARFSETTTVIGRASLQSPVAIRRG